MTLATIKDRPLLFHAYMVQSTLADLKTNTRRMTGLNLVNKLPDDYSLQKLRLETFRGVQYTTAIFRQLASDHIERAAIRCPYGKPGDRLWIRENLRMEQDKWIYGADKTPLLFSSEEALAWVHRQTKSYCPSIHMPRWASRITLEITDIRVERLQSISADDAVAEGIQPAYGKYWLDYLAHEKRRSYPVCESPIDSFRSLIILINGQQCWDDNKWVWVVEFKRAKLR